MSIFSTNITILLLIGVCVWVSVFLLLPMLLLLLLGKQFFSICWHHDGRSQCCSLSAYQNRILPPCVILMYFVTKKTEIIWVLVNGSGKVRITIMHKCASLSGIHYKMHTHIKFNTFQKVMFLALFHQLFFIP